MTSWLLAIAAVLDGFIGAAWLAFRKDRHEAHLGRIAEKLEAEPIGPTRIWERGGAVMTDGD